MTISTIGVGAAVTPTVIKTYVSHYANRKPRHQKPTAHISYDEGLHLVRSFLDFASHKTVEDLQAFTAQWVPSPSWVRTENVTIPAEHISKAADHIVAQLGNSGVNQIGGTKWWQWRRKGSELKAEWIDMKADYNERKHTNTKSRRVMLYVHGGGYFFGSVDEHRYQMQRHARKLKARVIAPRYRLAPQFPFPCGLHDVLAVYLYLLTLHDPTEIVLAGDSAGGGMVMSTLCILRDQGLPLPAGAILISPWVDLTHSFPSVAAGGDLDYIPAHGFQQRPSDSWPPPNEDEIAVIAKSAVSTAVGQAFPGRKSKEQRQSAEMDAIQGFEILETKPNEAQLAREDENNPAGPEDSNPRAGSVAPGPSVQLSIEIDGKMVILKDQIQMYTTNQLLSHPLVSPVLQPSLGGLPPLLILTGGGELLRDEQIYLAHKAANPARYPLGSIYKSQYDPEDTILKKYKPTPVQLQVWEDLCHVAPTLSFTRPAKFMYRSIAQFGAWALARAQKTAIEIADHDEISIISSGSDSGSEADQSSENLHKQTKPTVVDGVGKAGDSLPAFQHHMIRQRVDRHGSIFPLASEKELPATTMDPDLVGIIKPGPVKKWMEAKGQWDTQYASIKRKVQKQRVKEMAAGGPPSLGGGEHPPPSALVGRRSGREGEEKKKKKSFGLALWSGWGSKHDETTIKREEDAVREYNSDPEPSTTARRSSTPHDERITRSIGGGSSSDRRRSSSKQLSLVQTNRNRRGTISVTYEGQIEGQTSISGVLPTLKTEVSSSAASTKETPTLPNENRQNNDLLTPGVVHKFKPPPHLRDDLRDHSDAASMMTTHSQMISDNASTMAVFGAPGISHQTESNNSSERLGDSRLRDAVAATFHGSANRDKSSTAHGGDTPASRRSMERLQSHQVAVDDEADTDARSVSQMSTRAEKTRNLDARPQALRSPSTTAIVKQEGVVGIVDDDDADELSSVATSEKLGGNDNSKGDARANGTSGKEDLAALSTNLDDESTQDGGLISSAAKINPERPKIYDRANTDFQTAMEKL